MTREIMDVATEALLERACDCGIETGLDRLEAQQPQCGFGQLGTCCRICYMGPCRIDPFATDGSSRGVCGATADVIVTRNLLREATGGASSHIGHARHVALTLRDAMNGTAPYVIADRGKLLEVATGLGIAVEGKADTDIAKEVVGKALEDYGRQDGEPANWVAFRTPPKELEMWKGLGLAVSNVHNEIEEAMHRTSGGNDADPVNLLLGTLRMGVADGVGLSMATDLQDIMFGTPQVRGIEANVGVLDASMVNLAMHGHNPVLSEKIVEWSVKLDDEARSAGAEGINVVGVCCTGNELTMRHGVPMAGHNLQSELLLVTGAVDVMAVDVQCIWPGTVKVADCFDTKIITTEANVKIPGALHIPFEAANADEAAEEIVRTAIAAYVARKGKDVVIPQIKASGLAGFSVEAIVGVLSKIDPANPLKPVIDNIVAGNIYGAVAFAGCPNPKIRASEMTESMAKELLAKNVLIVTTGCTAHILAQAGMMSPDATEKYAGEGLKAVLTALGGAAGLDGPLPPVWHMGSCVDNSRIVNLLAALAGALDVKLSQLPVAGSAPELVQEKAVSIGSWLLALGLTVHVAPVLHVLGSPVATKVLTEDLVGITGGRAYVEYDPEKAAAGLLADIAGKRAALGI
ncbi:MAG: anaerobic carbon-monoxide dehydrogenase catalytic subunit [Coriobacteriia bacterium]